MSTAAAVIVGVAAASGGGGGSLGPSLWVLVMMVGAFLLSAWLRSEKCMCSSHGDTLGLSTYGLFGVASMLLIMDFTSIIGWAFLILSAIVASICMTMEERRGDPDPRIAEVIESARKHAEEQERLYRELYEARKGKNP